MPSVKSPSRPRHKNDLLSALAEAGSVIRLQGRQADFLRYLTDFAPWDTKFILDLHSLVRNNCELFAVATVFMGSDLRNSLWLIPSSALLSWTRALLELGDYEQCILLCNTSSSTLTLTVNHLMQVNPFEAKALRNLGRLTEALDAYRRALRLAQTSRREVDLCRILVLIGKVYGNYLGQKGLFLAFVEEAQSRLTHSLSFTSEEIDRRRVLRALAICEDSLGQAYRHRDKFGPARDYFEKAIDLNKQLNSINGIVRAECHLAKLSFLLGSGHQAKTESIGADLARREESRQHCSDAQILFTTVFV